MGVRKTAAALTRSADLVGIQIGVESRAAAVWLYGDNVSLVTSTELPPQQWHHLVYLFDGTSHRLFVNGTMVGASSRAKQVGVASTFPDRQLRRLHAAVPRSHR